MSDHECLYCDQKDRRLEEVLENLRAQILEILDVSPLRIGSLVKLLNDYVEMHSIKW